MLVLGSPRNCDTNNLEGGPAFASFAKAGLLRSKASVSLLWVLSFLVFVGTAVRGGPPTQVLAIFRRVRMLSPLLVSANFDFLFSNLAFLCLVIPNKASVHFSRRAVKGSWQHLCAKKILRPRTPLRHSREITQVCLLEVTYQATSRSRFLRHSPTALRGACPRANRDRDVSRGENKWLLSPAPSALLIMKTPLPIVRSCGKCCSSWGPL